MSESMGFWCPTNPSISRIVAARRIGRETRIPAIYAYREHVELGGLMAYSFDLEELYRDSARQIAEILKGANPVTCPSVKRPNSNSSLM